jgi:ferredoxin-thioredoxin reductase catalytic subunit
MGNMWPMMKGFARDFAAYRHGLGQQDEWIRKHAGKKGWSVNPRWMVYTNLRLWLSDCEEMYGRRSCPCFEPTGNAEQDRKLVCPCSYAQAEIDDVGWCHCTLFGRADLTPADYKRAEGVLMSEYRDVPLAWVDGVLDTRGQHVEPLRGLPVPDAIHQVKRALNGKGAPLAAIVATEVEAGHLQRLAEMRGLSFSSEQLTVGGTVVHLGE